MVVSRGVGARALPVRAPLLRDLHCAGKKFEQSSFAGLSQRYVFLKNSFTISVNGKEERAYYERLFDVWETPDAFYLYANARQAYIVAKAGFEQGTAEALAKHLRARMGEKKYKTVAR